MNLTTTTCRSCDEEFTYERKSRGRARIYCSESCSWKAWNRGERGKRRRLKFDFGITLEQWYELLESQGGVCAGCGQVPVYLPNDLPSEEKNPRNAGKLVLDHDHSTGVIRGLLCSNCNLALGNVSDSPQVLRQLADYLETVPRLGTLIVSGSSARTAQGSGGRG